MNIGFENAKPSSSKLEGLINWSGGWIMIIDFHTHINPPEVIEKREEYLTCDIWFDELYGDPKARLATAEELIAEMDAAGVDVAVTFGFGWTDMGLCRMANDYVMEAVARYPDRLIGFACVNPKCGSEAVQEVERCVAGGLKGIGELMPDGQGYCLDDEATMRPLVEAALARGLPILTHTSEPVGRPYCGKGTVTPDAVYRFTQCFPQVTLICAHWGGGLPFYELMPEMRRAFGNVYYDTAASLYLYNDAIFFLAAQLVSDKILFATDYPLITQRRFLRRVRETELEEEELNKILGGNANRIFELVETAAVAESAYAD
jgi:predicted TIM-barrel fold metal-dependent hydrolase